MTQRLARLPISLVMLLLVVIPHLLFALSKWHAIPIEDGIPIGQTDPDTWLRLTLVRDWLAGGSWYDHTVWNSNTPFTPTTSPWTRPVDLVIAAFVHIQPEAVDLSLRILRASLLLPVLWMGLMLAGIHRAVKRIAPFPAATVMATLLVLTQPGLWNYFLMGNADHHAPLAALFVWVLVGVLTPHPSRKLIILTGILFALQLWISVETFILIGVVYAYYGIHWLRGDSEKIIILTWLSTSIFIASLAALLIERPPAEWLTPIYDSISIVYLSALGFCALCAWFLRLAPARSQRERFIVSIVGGLLLVLGIAFTYPHIIAGPVYGVHPFILSDFLPRITEARPFYKLSPMEIVPFIIIPLSAALICLAPWIRRARAFYSNETSAMLAYFVIATLLLYYSQQRWSYYMLPVAIIALAPLLGALFTPEHPFVATRWPANTLHGLTPNQQMKRRLPVTLALMGMPIMLMLASAAPELMRNTVSIASKFISPSNNQTALRNACYTTARQLIRSGELARVLPKKPLNILAPTDLGTELLFFTPQRIVASNYHREGAGIAYAWGADKITDERELRRHLAARNIAAILICPKVEPEKDSLLQAYMQGKKLPAWLVRVEYELPTRPSEPKHPAPLSALLLRINSK